MGDVLREDRHQLFRPQQDHEGEDADDGHQAERGVLENLDLEHRVSKVELPFDEDGDHGQPNNEHGQANPGVHLEGSQTAQGQSGTDQGDQDGEVVDLDVAGLGEVGELEVAPDPSQDHERQDQDE